MIPANAYDWNRKPRHAESADSVSPRVSAVSYRVVLRVVPVDTARGHESRFDDFALIEWLTPALGAGEVPPHLPTGQASHADVIMR